jgi:hypothetical protein
MTWFALGIGLMDKFGADGDVIEINLATVKVRNLTIPPLRFLRIV